MLAVLSNTKMIKGRYAFVLLPPLLWESSLYPGSLNMCAGALQASIYYQDMRDYSQEGQQVPSPV